MVSAVRRSLVRAAVRPGKKFSLQSVEGDGEEIGAKGGTGKSGRGQGKGQGGLGKFRREQSGRGETCLGLWKAKGGNPNKTSRRSANRLRSYDHFCITKMAVSRHLKFYRTENCGIRSADPQNPRLEPNMESIGCTVCEIFAFKLCCDLETGVRGHSRSSKMAPFDRAHVTLYSSSIVTMPLSLTVSEI